MGRGAPATMAVRAASVPGGARPASGGGAGSAPAGRVRSASPSSIVSVREILPADHSGDNSSGAPIGSTCSFVGFLDTAGHATAASPPGVRRAPLGPSASARPAGPAASPLRRRPGAAASPARAESLAAAVAGLQQRGEADRRRLAQLERRLEEVPCGRPGGLGGGVSAAEVQGRVQGVLDECQALALRVEGLDSRFQAWTSRSEVASHRCWQLEQQLQAQEQHLRVAETAATERHRRAAAKLRRSERLTEELLQRTVAIEGRDANLGERLGALEEALRQQHREARAEVQDLQAQLRQGLQEAAGATAGALAGAASAASAARPAALADEARRVVQATLSALEGRFEEKVQHLASSVVGLRVKVDGQLQRVSALTERVEAQQHVDAVDSRRSATALAQAQHQDWREAAAEVAALRGRVQELAEASEENLDELRGELRRGRAEAAGTGGRLAEELARIRALQGRVAEQERELDAVRLRVETVAQEVKRPAAEVYDLQRMLEWVAEQQETANAAVRADQSCAQRTIRELVEQVACLRQQATSGEALCAALQRQLQSLQEAAAAWRPAAEAKLARLSPTADARIDAVAQLAAGLASRLVEVEGVLRFTWPHEKLSSSALSEGGGLLRSHTRPPQPPGLRLQHSRRSFSPGLGELQGSARSAGAVGSGAGALSAIEEDQPYSSAARLCHVVQQLAERLAALERHAPEEGGQQLEMLRASAEQAELEVQALKLDARAGHAAVQDLQQQVEDQGQSLARLVEGGVEIAERLRGLEEQVAFASRRVVESGCLGGLGLGGGRTHMQQDVLCHTRGWEGLGVRMEQAGPDEQEDGSAADEDSFSTALPRPDGPCA